jgi:hypothetical protein
LRAQEADPHSGVWTRLRTYTELGKFVRLKATERPTEHGRAPTFDKQQGAITRNEQDA